MVSKAERYGWWSFTEMNSPLAYLLGAFFGDGFVSRRGDRKGGDAIRFRITSKEFADRISNSLKQIELNPYSFIEKCENKKDVFIISKENLGFVDWIDSLPFDRALNLVGNGNFWSFISGFYDAEGNIQTRKSGTRRVRFTNNNKSWLESIKEELKRRGLKSYIYESSKKEGYDRTWGLAISGENAEKLMELIGDSR